MAFGKCALLGMLPTSSAIFPHKTNVGGKRFCCPACSSNAISTLSRKGRQALASFAGATCGRHTQRPRTPPLITRHAPPRGHHPLRSRGRSRNQVPAAVRWHPPHRSPTHEHAPHPHEPRPVRSRHGSARASGSSAALTVTTGNYTALLRNP